MVVSFELRTSKPRNIYITTIGRVSGSMIRQFESDRAAGRRAKRCRPLQGCTRIDAQKYQWGDGMPVEMTPNDH